MAIQVGSNSFNEIKIGTLSGGMPVIPQTGIDLANQVNPIIAGGGSIESLNADHVYLDTSTFDKNLDPTITDVQKLAEAVDELSTGGGSGTVASVNNVLPDINGNVSLTIPTQLSQLSDDSTHRVVTDTEKITWNNKLSSYTETDPVFVASQAHNITSGHITILNNTSGVNTGDQDLSGLQLISNKVNNFQAIPDDNHYPSEKLVADQIAYLQGQITQMSFAAYAGLVLP